MITISETYNKELINKILTDPLLYQLSQGADKDPHKHELDMSFTYLLIEDNDKAIGLFQVKEFTKLVAEVHINILPEYWGTGTGQEASYYGMKWLLDNTEYKKIFSKVPVTSVQVLKLNQKLGWQVSGRIKDGVCFNGQVQDLILFDKNLVGSV